jgi:hypothetical protein
MKKLILGSVLAAVAMFFWGFLYWAVSPLPLQVMSAVPNEPALSKTLAESLPASGVYLLPHPSGVSEDELAKRHRAGPLVQINIERQGTDPMQGSIFFWGFVHMLASCILMALVLWTAAPSAAGFGTRFRIAAVAGLAAACYSNLGKPIWWHQAWSYHLMNFGFDLGSWLLAAVVLAWFVRDPPS